jgi:serine/threonine-protein kinase
VRAGHEVEATPLLPVGDAGATQVIARQPTQVMPPPEPEGSSRKMWLGALIGILVLLMLLGGGYLLAQFLSRNDTPTQVPVRNVVGMTYDEAAAILQGQGFQVGRTDKESDAQPDTVLAQDPKPSTLWGVGETVTLTVAKPLSKVDVPNLQCVAVDDAANQLADADLTLGSKTPTTSDACPPNTIVDQNPKAGTQVNPGTIVNVTVASGPSTIILEDYTCQTYNKASHDLEKLGLVAALSDPVPSLPQCPNANFVAEQEPAAGATVQVGSTVTLHLGGATSPTPSPTP